VEPTQLLKQQHREVESLFQKLERTEDPNTCRSLLEEIQAKLELHMRIEEEIFYPAVRGLETKKSEETIHEAYEEHHVVKLVLAELPDSDPDDERFHAKMTVLSELIEHHVEEEEKEMFKMARRLGAAQLEELGERMSAVAGEQDNGAVRAGRNDGSGRGARRKSR
jgi:hypothetical protein